MIVSTEAIVLKSMKYGDSSRIVTFYTRQFGKVTVIAKGARTSKSRMSGAVLQPMSFSHITYYKKEARDLQFLSQADLIAQFSSILDSEQKLFPGLAIIEATNSVLHGEEEHEALFKALHSALFQLNAAEKNPVNQLLRFFLDLSTALGFAIDMDHCLRCRKSFHEEKTGEEGITGNSSFDAVPDGSPTAFSLNEPAVQKYASYSQAAAVGGNETSGPKYLFEVQSGGFYCPDCTGVRRGMMVYEQTFHALQNASNADPSRVWEHTYSKVSLGQALQLLQKHLSVHVPDMRPLKTMSMFESFS